MKRSITGALAAAFVSATVAAAIPMGFIAPANADPSPLSGRYAIVGGAEGFYVNVTSNCATRHRRMHRQPRQQPRLDQRRHPERRRLELHRHQARRRRSAPTVATRRSSIAYSVDAATLAGTITANSNGDCPGGQVTQAAFQLQRIG